MLVRNSVAVLGGREMLGGKCACEKQCCRPGRQGDARPETLGGRLRAALNRLQHLDPSAYLDDAAVRDGRGWPTLYFGRNNTATLSFTKHPQRPLAKQNFSMQSPEGGIAGRLGYFITIPFQTPGGV